MQEKNPSTSSGSSKLETVLRRTTARPFRFKFAVLYISIVGAVAYLNGLANCRSGLVFDATSIIGVLLFALLGLEWYEEARLRSMPPLRVGLGQLALRIALIEAIVWMDCTKTAVFLYPMIPYSVYFSLGSRSSIALSFFFVAFNGWRTHQANPQWYADPGTASTMMGLTFFMLFVPLVAHIIRVDDTHRQETEKLLADLEHSHQRLQAYTMQVAELAAAEERVRLARDIHDSLGHALTAVHIQLEKALAYQERNPVEATQAIRDAKQAAAEALRDIRLSVGALRSSDASFDLRLELEKLARSVDSPALSVTLDYQGLETERANPSGQDRHGPERQADESLYSRQALTALYRAAQEGLTNIRKHAKARHVLLRVVVNEKSARLVLRDDGIGFEPQKWLGGVDGGNGAAGNRKGAELDHDLLPGYGLRGLRERLELLHGRLTVQSDPQQGTVLTAEIPCVAAALQVVDGENIAGVDKES